MPTPKKGPRFGGTPAHHSHMLANLTTELIRHGRITTTHARAKNVQPLAERMVTFGKRGDVHARRQAGRVIRDDDVLHRLFAEVGPANAQRPGGYTRILKLGPRKGDAAPMALIELVDGPVAADPVETESGSRRRWGLRRQRQGTEATAAETGAATTGTAVAEPPAGAEGEDAATPAEGVPDEAPLPDEGRTSEASEGTSGPDETPESDEAPETSEPTESGEGDEEGGEGRA